MIRRRQPLARVRKTRHRRGASAWNGLALAKGLTRPQEKRKDADSAKVLRMAVRAYVLQRDGECRARCGGPCSHFPYFIDIHEEPPRSQGGDPLNVRDCLALCRPCHRRATGELHAGRTLYITKLDPHLGTDGPLRFRDERTGRIWDTLPLRRPPVPPMLQAILDR